MDEFDLFHNGQNQGVVATDGSGTTIIFYDSSSSASKEMNELYGDEPFSKANKKLKNSFQKATEKIEEVANIRFFDINNLSKDDIAFINKSGIKIADKAHINLSYATFDEKSTGGAAEFPDDGQEFVTVRNGDDKRSDTYLNNFDHIVMHELLHSLGFIHSHESKYEKMSQTYDYVENTHMSYISLGADGNLGDIDIYNLRKHYGENEDYLFEFNENNLTKKPNDILTIANQIIDNGVNISDKEREAFNKIKENLLDNEGNLSPFDEQIIFKAAQIFELNKISQKNLDKLDEATKVQNPLALNNSIGLMNSLDKER